VSTWAIIFDYSHSVQTVGIGRLHRSYHPHCKAHYLAGEDVGSPCGRRRAIRSCGSSWPAMASRYFAGRNHRIFRAQRKRARSCATEAQPGRSGLSIIMGKLSYPSLRFPAFLEMGRCFIPDANFSCGFRWQNAEGHSDWTFHFLHHRCSVFARQNEHEAVEVASLALSTLRMCFPWFLEQAVATEKVRLLRLSESR